MKKLIFSFILAISFLQTGSAQDLSTIVSDFSSVDNAQYQIIDRATLDASMATARNSEAMSSVASQIPPFMSKVDSVEVLDLSHSAQDVKNKFIERFNSIKDENGYETLTSVSDENDKARIMAKREGDIISEILILAVDNEDNEIVIVKMSGKLDNSDIDDIVKQQTK